MASLLARRQTVHHHHRPPTLVAHTALGSTTNNSVTTTAINTTGATYVLVAMAVGAGGALTDSYGNTWNQLLVENSTSSGDYGYLTLCYCYKPTVGAGHTFTVTGTGDAPAVAVQAWSNVAPNVDISVGAIGSVNGTIAPGSMTPAQNGELIVTAALYDDTTALSVSGGFTISDQVAFVSSEHFGVGMAYLAQGAAAAVNPSWTWPSSTAPGSVVMLSLSPAAAYAPTGVSGSWALVFDDEFPGATLNTALWSDAAVSQNDVTTSPANVSVSGGSLVLALPSVSSGAEVITYFELPVGGICEARINFAGSGASIYNWPAWWASGSNWPVNGENDIAEGLGGALAISYHYGTSGSPLSGPNDSVVSGSWAAGYHVYTLERLATTANVYYDGVLALSYSTDDAGGGQQLILTLGSGQGTAEYGSAGNMLVDYVRAWVPA